MNNAEYTKDQIKKGYIECLHFADTPTDKNDFYVENNGLSDRLNKKIDEDIDLFIKKAKNLIKQALRVDNYYLDDIGHDFWLTRNGHGAGFWDRDLGEVGDKLTKIAESFGSVYLYVFKNELYHEFS